MSHGANAKRCSSEGFTNQAKKGGVCKRHGAKVKVCSKDKEGALMKSSKEECETRDKGKSMQMQRKVAQFMLRKEECARDMRQLSKSIGMG